MTGTLRILLSAGINLDNFYEEKELAKDPFGNLNNLLDIFDQKNCDFCALLGDLFVRPNPSNSAMASALTCFRNKVVDEEAAGNGRDSGFETKGSFKVNYKHSGLNIKIPVFAIHGQKDGPSKESIVSPIEILSQSNYVNYVGKVKKGDILKVKPILFKKEQTKIAVYFLSHIKEATLSKLLFQKKIKFLEPEEEGYMKILMINQKRSKDTQKHQAYPTLDIHPHQLPQIFDLIVWAGCELIKGAGLDSMGTTRASNGGDSDLGVKILNIENLSIDKIRSRDLRERCAVVLSITEGKIFVQKVPLMSTRPFIVMRINSEFIDVDNHHQESLKTEEQIERQVIQRLGLYYQKDGKARKPILRVIIKLRTKNYLRLKSLEEKFKGLVANFGKVFELNRSRSYKISQEVKKELMSKKNELLRIMRNASTSAYIKLDYENLRSMLSKSFEKANTNSSFLKFSVENLEAHTANPHLISSLLRNQSKSLMKTLRASKYSERVTGKEELNQKCEALIRNFDYLSAQKQSLDAILKEFESQFDFCHKMRTLARDWVYGNFKEIDCHELSLIKKTIDIEEIEEIFEDYKNEQKGGEVVDGEKMEEEVDESDDGSEPGEGNEEGYIDVEKMRLAEREPIIIDEIEFEQVSKAQNTRKGASGGVGRVVNGGRKEVKTDRRRIDISLVEASPAKGGHISEDAEIEDEMKPLLGKRYPTCIIDDSLAEELIGAYPKEPDINNLKSDSEVEIEHQKSKNLEFSEDQNMIPKMLKEIGRGSLVSPPQTIESSRNEIHYKPSTGYHSKQPKSAKRDQKFEDSRKEEIDLAVSDDIESLDVEVDHQPADGVLGESRAMDARIGSNLKGKGLKRVSSKQYSKKIEEMNRKRLLDSKVESSIEMNPAPKVAAKAKSRRSGGRKKLKKMSFL